MKNLIKDMKNCWQVEGKQTIWDHGKSVYSYTQDLINTLKGHQSVYNQKIPEWMFENKELILKHLVSDRELKLYTIFHDCGKPYCKPDT